MKLLSLFLLSLVSLPAFAQTLPTAEPPGFHVSNGMIAAVAVVLGIVALWFLYKRGKLSAASGVVQRVEDAVHRIEGKAAPAAPAKDTATAPAAAAQTAPAQRDTSALVFGEIAQSAAPQPMLDSYIDRDDLMKAIGANGCTQAVYLDGALVHNGFGPGMHYVTDATGVHLAEQATGPVTAAAPVTHATFNDGSNAPAGFPRFSPEDYPLVYPLGPDGQPTGAPALLLDGQTFTDLAALNDYKTRSAAAAGSHSAPAAAPTDVPSGGPNALKAGVRYRVMLDKPTVFTFELSAAGAFSAVDDSGAQVAMHAVLPDGRTAEGFSVTLNLRADDKSLVLMPKAGPGQVFVEVR